MATYADVDRILAQANGTFQGPVYGGVHQCVAWAATFSGDIGNTNFMPTPATGGARDVYEQFSAPLPSQYDRIANTPSFVPQKGDIVVWGAMPGNTYGHIAVASGDGDTNTFRSYDQNWVHGQAVTLTNHNYNYVLGVLRAKNLTAGTPQGDTSMKPTTEQMRYIHVDSEGWNWKDAMAGKFDQQFSDSWGWRPLTDMLADKWSVKNDGWRQTVADSVAYYQNVRPGVESQVKSQQDQIAQLSSQNKQLQDQVATLQAQSTSVPGEPHQDPAQVVADQLKPAVSFWQKVIQFLRS